MVPDTVIDYIKNERLYGYDEVKPDDGGFSCTDRNRYSSSPYRFFDADFERIAIELRNSMDKERFIHTIGVMYTAGFLASTHAPELKDKAYIAGLLHDCAKCIPKEERYRVCMEYEIELNVAERKNAGLVHAKLGAYLAGSRYGVDDEEIQHAISVHTTGCPDMSMLDKIIYLADFTEPLRDMEPISIMDEARRLCRTDLDMAVGLVADHTVRFLEKKGVIIDDATARTSEFYGKKE